MARHLHGGRNGGGGRRSRDTRSIRCIAWLGQLSICGTNIDDHDDANWRIQPKRDGVVAHNLNLTLALRGISISEISSGVRVLAKTKNEIHDLAPMGATFWDRIQESNMHVNLMGLHEKGYFRSS